MPKSVSLRKYSTILYDPHGSCSITTGAREVMNPAAGTVYTWTGVPTCRERARVPIGRCVAYVYSTRHALGGSYCTGTGVQGVPLSG